MKTIRGLFKVLISKLNSKADEPNPKKTKDFKIKDIRELITPMGGCIATDRITVDGLPVDYMYREEPINELDSGWRFFSGTEDQEYLDHLDNSGVYEVNTIANYDESIIPYLDFPDGVQLEKNQQTGKFELIPG